MGATTISARAAAILHNRMVDFLVLIAVVIVAEWRRWEQKIK
jgi:hypothetical protein